MASVSSMLSAQQALRATADGVGLVRTELLFAGSDEEPSVYAQATAYMRIAERFPGKPVILRTWDPAEDKVLQFLAARPKLPDAGAWSWRGIRCYRNRPDVLDRQLGAFLQTAELSKAQVHVLAPMVAQIDEVAWFAERARQRGILRVGVMVEVPALALVISHILSMVDFVSIGLSDLSQFTFAASRAIPEMSDYLDPWQPAVLKLVDSVARSCAASDTPITICGVDGRSGALVAVLAGMGVHGVTLPASRLAEVRQFMSRVSGELCRSAALTAVSCGSAGEAKTAAYAALRLHNGAGGQTLM
ncbi:hypothetical protein GCM10029964_089550 [Kibdelosporangium lantanae]